MEGNRLAASAGSKAEFGAALAHGYALHNMDLQTCFRLPRILLPSPGIDLAKWAVIACDQYTSEPDYWRSVAREVGEAPSTLHMIFPETYLGTSDATSRIRNIQDTMRSYLANGMFRERA